MTVKELIEELEKYPGDLPVAANYDAFSNYDGTIETDLSLKMCHWEHTNYPYDRPEFDYLNIE